MGIFNEMISIPEGVTVLNVGLQNNRTVTVAVSSTGEVFPNANAADFSEKEPKALTLTDPGNAVLTVNLPHTEIVTDNITKKPKEISQQRTVDLTFSQEAGALIQVTRYRRGIVHSDADAPYPTIVRYDAKNGAEIDSGDWENGRRVERARKVENITHAIDRQHHKHVVMPETGDDETGLPERTQVRNPAELGKPAARALRT